MKKTFVQFFWVWLCLFGISRLALAVPAIGGRGGPFMEFHFSNLSSFDSAVHGNPIVVGGTGFGTISKNFRLGGSGGGGFIFTGSDNLQFGMGYGGVIAEYIVTNWLAFRMLIGGGGYSIVKVLSETNTQVNLEKLSTGGFFLFYPSTVVEIPMGSWMKLQISLGYFLPNVSRLDSMTFTISLAVGRT